MKAKITRSENYRKLKSKEPKSMIWCESLSQSAGKKLLEEKQIAKVFDFEGVAFRGSSKISLIEDGKSPKTIESYVGEDVLSKNKKW